MPYKRICTTSLHEKMTSLDIQIGKWATPNSSTSRYSASVTFAHTSATRNPHVFVYDYKLIK